VTYYEVPLSSGPGTSILVVPKDQESAQNSLVILMHGLGDDCSYPLLHWIRFLNANGMSVLSFDWDGHGAGGASILDFQQATRSLPLLLYRLFGDENRTGLGQQRTGINCFVMGHSMGGALALIAATRPDVARTISGLIVVSPTLIFNSYAGFAREFWNYLYPTAWFKDFLNKISYYGLSGLFPARGAFKRTAFPLRIRTAIDYGEQARNFVNETFCKRRVLRDVRIPVLWMHGMKDRIAPYSQVASLMIEIPSAFFAYNDEKRGHLRMAFSDQIPKYCAFFIKQCYELKALQ
jgi:alpha-beta hydrolase superfamily lysophospholipase